MFSWMRSWVLDARAEAELDRAVAEHPRIEEEIRGVEWVLVRSPEKGQQVAPDVYLYVNERVTPNASLITVLYSYDHNHVEVLRLWIR